MSTIDDRPTVILPPAPQRTDRIFTPRRLEELHRCFNVVDLVRDDGPEALDEALRIAFAVIGQPDLSRERLALAPNLRVICNVEGNFFPNVD